MFGYLKMWVSLLCVIITASGISCFIFEDNDTYRMKLRSWMSCEKFNEQMSHKFDEVFRAISMPEKHRKLGNLGLQFDSSCEWKFNKSSPESDLESCSYFNLEFLKFATGILNDNQGSKEYCIFQMKKIFSEMQLMKNSNCSNSKEQELSLELYAGYWAIILTAEQKNCLMKAMEPNYEPIDCVDSAREYLSNVAQTMISFGSTYKDLLHIQDPILPSCERNVLLKMQNKYTKYTEISCQTKFDNLMQHLVDPIRNICQLKNTSSVFTAINEANCSYTDLEVMKEQIFNYIRVHYGKLELPTCETLIVQNIARKQAKLTSNCGSEDAQATFNTAITFWQINPNIVPHNDCLKNIMATNNMDSAVCLEESAEFLDYVAKYSMSPKYTVKELKFTHELELPACEGNVLKHYKKFVKSPSLLNDMLNYPENNSSTLNPYAVTFKPLSSEKFVTTNTENFRSQFNSYLKQVSWTYGKFNVTCLFDYEEYYQIPSEEKKMCKEDCRGLMSSMFIDKLNPAFVKFLESDPDFIEPYKLMEKKAATFFKLLDNNV